MSLETHYYMDQIDADQKVGHWMKSVIERFGERYRIFLKIEHYSLSLGPGTYPNGGVTVIWYNDKQIGIATTVRDDKNFSVLTIANTDSFNYGETDG